MSKPRTVLTWTYGDIALQVITADAPPEQVETMLHKAGREFVGRVRELCDDTLTIDHADHSTEILAAYDVDQETSHEQ